MKISVKMAEGFDFQTFHKGSVRGSFSEGFSKPVPAPSLEGCWGAKYLPERLNSAEGLKNRTLQPLSL